MIPAIDGSAHATATSPLTLSDERGGAMLVCGGSSSERRDRMDALVASMSLGEGARPVIVRVSARVGEISLGDAIAAAAEAELTRIRAPGGLYDDPGGGALASLGGWLFRARAVRCHGVLIAIDDVDAWMDARGATVESPALGVLRRMLDECGRRPLAVLISVRGSDARGEPALPADLVTGFTQIDRLGGLPSVTRDPMSLVIQLAGRSFTVGALKQALSGWLDLPTPSDDAVVVFSSPLGPPAVGLEPVETELAFARPELTSEGTVPAVSPPVLGEGWGDAVRAALDVRDALRGLQGLDAPHGARQWERMFWDAGSKLPTALIALERGERALGLEATRIGRRGRDALDRFDTAFREYYGNAYDAWLGGTARPTMLCDLPQRITRLATERQARSTAFVLITGLRVDAWHRIRQRVLPRVAGLTVIEEGVHWAARPATSQVQRELLARGVSALGASLPPRDEPPAPRTPDEALKPRREHLGHHEVLRLDAYALDAALPGEGDLTANWERIERALAPALLALCGTFAGRAALAIAGDAGTREVRRRETETAPMPRGAMGGDSAFEVLVPYALLTWG